ncbi:hypothetical protein D3C72_2140770 [compost metagenome]
MEKNIYLSDSLFKAYALWCKNNNIKQISSIIFGKELKRLGYSKIKKQKDGKRNYYYIKLS